MDRLLENNTVLRLLAIVLACILWFAVASGGNGTSVPGGIVQRFPFPVHVQVDEDEVVTSLDTTTADVVVTGDAVNVTSLPGQMAGVEVVADARGLTPGRHVVRLTALNMPTVSYTVQPATVTLVIEKKFTEREPVQITVEGQPAAGYEVGRPTLDVPEVHVSGPRAAVESVAQVGATVSVQGASQTLTKAVSLTAFDEHGNPVPGVSLNPSTVTVIVPVQPPKLTLPVQPQITGNPASGYAVAGVRADPSMVTAYGTPAQGSWSYVAAPVDVSGWSATRTVRVPIRRASGMTRVDPAEVTVTVEIDKSASRIIPQLPVTVLGHPASGRVTLVGSPTVDVTLSGPAGLVSTLTAEDVKVFIDASVLHPGDTSAPVQVTVPEWVTVSHLSAERVPVQVH